jgi:hypothetical protein
MLTSSYLLPPSAKGRKYERKALQIRQFAGVRVEEPLDPFRLAGYARLQVVALAEIRGLSAAALAQLLDTAPDSWSGGASRPLPDGSRLIILNPTHSRERQAATLMEEICHVFLGHIPSRIAAAGQSQQPKGVVSFRDYNEADEEEAYAVGAAALLPYHVLRVAAESGRLSIIKLAKRYGVSSRLVEYRLKVSQLWGVVRAAGGERGW